jgi:hypothetical protein
MRLYDRKTVVIAHVSLASSAFRLRIRVSRHNRYCRVGSRTMAYPLGPRYVQGSARAKKVRLKPASDTYLVNVNIPMHVVEEELPGTKSAYLMNSPTMSVTPGAESFGNFGNFEASLRFGPQRRNPLATSAGSLTPPAAGSALFAVQSRRGLGTEYSDNAAAAIVVHLRTADTVSTAVETIVSRYNSTHNEPLPRPPRDYMLCVCFADFSLDTNYRALHGDYPAPMVQFLPFPYYLSLQVNLYQQRRDVLVSELELSRRHALYAARRTFSVFAAEYAALLRRMHQVYYFLLGRDADARQSKKAQEIQDRHEVELRIVLSRERSGRAALIEEQERAWAVTSFVTRALIAHCEEIDECRQYCAREHGAAHRRVLRQQENAARVAELLRRFDELHNVIGPRLEEEGKRLRRDAYTEARVASSVRLARERGVDLDTAHTRRVQAGIERHPDLYQSTPTLNRNSILGDVYSSSRSLV